MKKSMTSLLLVLYWPLINGDQCYFGKHSSVPAKSCQNVVEIQPSCFGDSGFYWIRKTSTSNLEYVYCDMDHRGGGWRRVIYYHSNLNTSCPSGLLAESLFGGTHTYCTRLSDNENFSYFTWNSNGNVEFSEVRGYVTMKVKESATAFPDAFDDRANVNLEYGYQDGFEFLTGTYPGGILRVFFSYVIGFSSGDRCPFNGGSEYNIGRMGYRSYSYACDEIQSGGAIDSEGFFEQDLFNSNDSCIQCPAGSPWFEKTYTRVTNTKVYGRIVNADSDDEEIYLSAVELYVR